MSEAWKQWANCSGLSSELFFPDNPSTSHAVLREAKAVCNTCMVRDACFRYALGSNGGRREVVGVWGSVNFASDYEVKKARKRVAA